MYLGNLLVIASTAVLAVATPATEIKKRVKTFQFFGVSESGAEFGDTVIPGQLGKDYTWPPTYALSSIPETILVEQNSNFFSGLQSTPSSAMA
jgi:endoglucanase